MTKLSQKKVEQFFADYGWDLECVEQGVWQTGFSGSHRYFPMTVHLNKTMLSLVVCPLVEKSLWDTATTDKFHKILQLNSELQLVKLEVNQRGDLCLSGQHLSQEMSYPLFCQFIEVLGYYCEEVSHILTFMNCDSALAC